MKNELAHITNKLKSYGLNDEQISELTDDIYKLAMMTAHYLAQEEVSSALDSLARFGK